MMGEIFVELTLGSILLLLRLEPSPLGPSVDLLGMLNHVLSLLQLHLGTLHRLLLLLLSQHLLNRVLEIEQVVRELSHNERRNGTVTDLRGW